VIAIFSSMPTDLTITYLQDRLKKLKIKDNKIKDLINLTKLYMSQNVFQFNNKFFEHIKGTAMGNPLSPFLAEVFISRFETNCRKNMDNFPEILYRYVDDIFTIIDKEFKLEEFFENLNSKHTSIQFTCEIEIEGRLPFLDLCI